MCSMVDHCLKVRSIQKTWKDLPHQSYLYSLCLRSIFFLQKATQVFLVYVQQNELGLNHQPLIQDVMAVF